MQAASSTRTPTRTPTITRTPSRTPTPTPGNVDCTGSASTRMDVAACYEAKSKPGGSVGVLSPFTNNGPLAAAVRSVIQALVAKDDTATW